MLRAAVVGVGSMGQNHARVYRSLPDVDLVAVADTQADRAERAGRLYDAAPYADCRDMLAAAKPDIVSVAVPTETHSEVARECLLAGCHVLVEKPIATTVDQGLSLVELADRAGRVLMVGHVERFNPAVIELKRRISGGQLGRIVYMLCRRLGPFPHTKPKTGVLMDLACHDIDMMLHLAGGEVIGATGGTKSVHGGPREDFATAFVWFSTGVLGVLEASWVTPTKVRELWVTGENGMFVLNYLTQDLCFYQNNVHDEGGAGWDVLRILRGGAEGCMIKYGVHGAEPLYLELYSFVEAVRRGTPSPAATRDAVRVLEVIDLIGRSSAV